MAKLFIPVGIPGCGKTTFAEKVLRHGLLEIYSTDAIRDEVHPQAEFSDERNPDVFAIFHRRIEDSLLAHIDVVADATNLRDFAREKLRAIAEQTGAEAHLIVFTNPSVAVLRNMKRERVVPPEVMVKMLEQYEQMLRDLPQETYTSVTLIEATL